MAQAAHEPEEPPTGGSEAPRAPQWLLEPGRTCHGAVAPASAALGSCPPSSLLVPGGSPHAEGETPVFVLARLGRQRPAGFRALGRPCLKAWLKEARAAPGRRLPLSGSGPWSSGGRRKNPLAPLRAGEAGDRLVLGTAQSTVRRAGTPATAGKVDPSWRPATAVHLKFKLCLCSFSPTR